MHVVDALLHLVIQTVDMQLLAQPGFDDPAVVGNLSGIGFGGAGLPQRAIDEVLQRTQIRSSSLPRNPVGKLLKQQLRGEYERDGRGIG